AAYHPERLQEQLGPGRPLDGSVKCRMENAFSHDFSRVRVHTDSRAAELSNDLNARAFTVGSHISFGSGEYKPGTLVGDAVLAHELSHVLQQEAGSSIGPTHRGVADYEATEEDADTSAAPALASSWFGSQSGLGSAVLNAGPRIRSGLQLSRCGKEAKTTGP